MLNGQAKLGYVFGALTVDGRFGLMTRNGSASFDTVTVKTNDPAVASTTAQLMAMQSATPTANVTSIQEQQLQPLIAEAKRRWAATGLVDLAALAAIQVNVANLNQTSATDRVLGQTQGQVITIDDNAAGWGWFIDSTPGRNEEYRYQNGNTLLAKASTAAAGHMDLITVLMHEIGHALGYDHSPADSSVSLMDSTLAPGIRLLSSTTDASMYFNTENFPQGGDNLFARAGIAADVNSLGFNHLLPQGKNDPQQLPKAKQSGFGARLNNWYRSLKRYQP
jgi:hypothetical protein